MLEKISKMKKILVQSSTCLKPIFPWHFQNPKPRFRIPNQSLPWTCVFYFLGFYMMIKKFQVNPDDQEAVCSKSVQTDQNALNEKRNGYYNGLFGNICCEEVIIWRNFNFFGLQKKITQSFKMTTTNVSKKKLWIPTLWCNIIICTCKLLYLSMKL